MSMQISVLGGKCNVPVNAALTTTLISSLHNFAPQKSGSHSVIRFFSFLFFFHFVFCVLIGSSEHGLNIIYGQGIQSRYVKQLPIVLCMVNIVYLSLSLLIMQT